MIIILVAQNSDLEYVMVFKIVSHINFRAETGMSSASDILGSSPIEL